MNKSKYKRIANLIASGLIDTMPDDREVTISERLFTKMAIDAMVEVASDVVDGPLSEQHAVPVAIAKIQRKIFPKEVEE